MKIFHCDKADLLEDVPINKCRRHKHGIELSHDELFKCTIIKENELRDILFCTRKGCFYNELIDGLHVTSGGHVGVQNN